ncbi:2OG-Fe(II) oxygenase and isochorismatase domain protein [Metarhizium robertsii]|uniref:Isochorismatase n=2 Tax=Metarhizium robertsii TaxID=568076 RepID=E9F7J2_METRA|nr:isochorismatase [Metarhizium robertsii ARSEF 23]EFY96329.1 isochorismatase [Metarhizium robertsii ARSEF 23]EXU98609.1 2OG-Fe(II) oxygenase and isochorismatase domain protein [Metarhizium robertsii]
MFSFDKDLLPKITTRKALILVDFQNDFLDPDGALPCSDPDGFINRAVELVANFRGNGDIIWLQSQFSSPVLVDHESIIVSDAPPVTRHRGRRSRGRHAAPALPQNPDEPLDPEAFLSHPEAKCVKSSSWGALMSPAVEIAVKKGDTILSKPQYSGFRGTQLLLLLRAKMVMEVYICGSLANVGVYATALDAAGHGLSITIVEDCCGYRNEQRQLAAVRSLIELTGCEIASLGEILENLQPKRAAKAPIPAGRKPDNRIAVADSPDLVQHMAGLRLDAEPSAVKVGNGTAPSPNSKADSQSAKPKQQETAGKDKKLKEKVPEDVESRKQVVEKDDLGSSIAEATDRQQEALSTYAKPHPNIMASQPVTSDNDEEQLLQKGLCEGDTDIIDNVLHEDLAKDAFEKLRDEVQWQRMLHQGGEVPRLVAVQGEVSNDGSMPVYRHPSDESPPLLPFSPTVLAIKSETEKYLGHELNHVLIQFYRDGKDYISEHSDKTVDVVKGSYIANVSLGAERTMVFRTKRQGKDPSRDDASSPGDTRRQSQRARLPHNSLCRMGLKTNMKWLHSIRQDKRAEREKTPAELAFKGGRISLTFRQIGTFLDKDETSIWGQGATGKSRETARPVVNGQSPEAVEMLKAFGAENNSSAFDWEEWYGKGFDVLHFSNSPRFFASADATSNMRIHLMLAEYGINFAKGSMAPDPKSSNTAHAAIRFVDNNASKSVVDGDVAIMLYLNSVYGHDKKDQADLALRFTRFQGALKLGDLWKQHDSSTPLSKTLLRELGTWDEMAANTSEVGMPGSTPSLADFAVWPVLHAIVDQYGTKVFDGMGALKGYYERFGEREVTKQVVGK